MNKDTIDNSTHPHAKKVKEDTIDNNIDPHAKKLRGTVLRFNPIRGYGFIVPDNPPSKNSGELFFHYSEIQVENEADYRTIRKDQRVEFEIFTAEDGRLFAVQIQAI